MQIPTQPQQETEKPKKKPWFRDFCIDILGIASLASVGYGVYLIHEPSAFIVMGVIIFTLIVLIEGPKK